MRRTLAVLLGSIAVAACGGDEPSAATPTTSAVAPSTVATSVVPTSAAATTTPSAATTTAAPPLAGSDLPVCTAVHPEFTETGTTHPDCSLVTGDPAHVYEVRFSEADAATGDATMTITALDGTQPTIEEAVGGTFESPSIADIDRDGTEELLVPLFTGAQNTAYAVWARPVPGEPFVRAGEVGGLGFGLTADGYIVVSGHASAVASYADVYLLRNGTLVPIASLELDVELDTCTVTQTTGLGEIGLDEATAHDRFCADPAIGG